MSSKNEETGREVDIEELTISGNTDYDILDE